MSKRFGKKRVPECQCTSGFTCGPCLRAAPAGVFTSTPIVVAGFFPNERDPVPDAMWEAVCERWQDLRAKRRPDTVADLALILNDRTSTEHAEIARMLEKYGF